MSPTILITSFDIWEPHHRSNSSDDLLTELLVRDGLSNYTIHFLRKIPVEFQLAPERAIAAIEEFQPDIVVCCGMAERRSRLTVEANGKQAENILFTPIDLAALTRDLDFTDISHDAGQFVCNHLYYSVLNYLCEKQPKTNCVFVHVPLLNDENLAVILQDFRKILERLALIASEKSSEMVLPFTPTDL